MWQAITDVPGVHVGQVQDVDAVTGCTVLVFPEGAVGGVEVCGSASGTRELTPLNGWHLTPHVHAICLAGGSAFGLDAAGGVMQALEAQGIGYQTRAAWVPIVPAAIIYDLGIGSASRRPDVTMGYAACQAAVPGPVAEGNVGAGMGATVGKFYGMDHAMKGGVGTASAELEDGVWVGALAVCNALGDVRDAATGALLAGARQSRDSMVLADTARLLSQSRLLHQEPGAEASGNTTLGVVATNVGLTKPQVEKLAKLAQHGLVKALSPAHTVFDGDTVFAVSTGTATGDFTRLGIVAAELLAVSLARSVRLASSLAGVPGLGDRAVE